MILWLLFSISVLFFPVFFGFPSFLSLLFFGAYVAVYVVLFVSFLEIYTVVYPGCVYTGAVFQLND